MKVTLVQIGDVKTLEVTQGATVKQAIAAKGGVDPEYLQTENLQVRLNGAPLADLDVVLNDGDALLVVGNIAGA